MFCISSSIRFALCGVGGTLLLSGFVFLNFMDQDDARHNFGHSGGMVNNKHLTVINLNVLCVLSLSCSFPINLHVTWIFEND